MPEGSTLPAPYVYSRESAPNATRLEAILSSLCHGYSLVYASGLAAFHALLVRLNPKVLAIGGGYHGIHEVAEIHTRLTGLRLCDLHDEAAWDKAGLGKGDIVHIETPVNPTGEAYNIQHYADIAHKRGAYLTVDATFGPPGLQDPFLHGADFILHSGTKYIGGHSDMLCGVLVTRPDNGWHTWNKLQQERLALGSVVGNLESWLGARSVRTMQLRVKQQSRSATDIVQWLQDAITSQTSTEDAIDIRKVVDKVQHASLQKSDMEWLKNQMPNGFGPVFVIWMKSEEIAKTLPSKLHLFQHATSLGGVESLVEWRTLSDDRINRKILRFSIGVEDCEDLKQDLLQAFRTFITNQ